MIVFSYKTHSVFAVILGAILSYYLNLQIKDIYNLFFYYFALVLGGLLPDIDTKTSIISKFLFPISWIFRIFFKHRGFTHSALAILIMLILTIKYWDVNPLFFIGLTIGYISHIFLDMLTSEGVVLFYPFFKIHIRLRP